MSPYENKCAWCGRFALQSEMYVTVRRFTTVNYSPTGFKPQTDEREETLYFDKHACRNEYLYGM